MLNFIGSGSAFNTNLGNNGVYIKKDSELFLIDCGSNTFDRLLKYGILNNVETINVLITHTHPDHIGSLGDLIFYAYYSLLPMFRPKVNVIYPNEITNRVETILELTGVKGNLYKSTGIGDYITISDFSIYPVSVKHVKELECFGYLISIKDNMIYYSGDCHDIPIEILDMFQSGKIDYFYQDTCKADYDGNVHLSLRKLTELIKPEFRNKVYCMHLDQGFDYK